MRFSELKHQSEIDAEEENAWGIIGLPVAGALILIPSWFCTVIIIAAWVWSIITGTR